MALVVNNGPCFDAAAVFTRNRVVAAPVKLSREAVADGTLQAVIYNSGNANACNGEQGDKDAAAMVAAVSEHTGIPVANNCCLLDGPHRRATAHGAGPSGHRGGCRVLGCG